MASTSAATTADQITGGPQAGNQTSSGQTGELRIEDGYVAKPPSRLPIPKVLDKSHLSEIKKFNEEDHKFWTIQYGAARGFQATQAKLLHTLETEELERQKDIKAFQTAPEELLAGPTDSARQLRLQFKEQVAKLEEVNNAIASTNLAADRDEFFGQVHAYLLLEPKLNDQYDFESIVTTTPALQRSLAKPYRKAFELQHYHLNYMKATEGGARDSSIESRILDELTNINDDIEDFVLVASRERLLAERKNEEQELKRSQDGKVSKEQKKNLDQKYKLAVKKIEVSCLVYVPNEGEDDYTLEEENDDDSDTESLMSGINDEPHIEDPGNGEGGKSEKQPLPKEIYEIRSRMGGRDGPLFLHIDAKLHGERNNEAEEKLKSLASEVNKFCELKGISQATYALNDSQIDAFCGMVVEVNASLVLLKANLSDTNAQIQYKLLRSRAALFIQQHQWPEAFLDTFVPTEDEIIQMVQEEQEAVLKSQQEKEAALKSQQEKDAALKAQQEKDAALKAQAALTSAEAPPLEDTDEQCIISVSIPGVVVEEEDGISRQKRVSGIRKSGLGRHDLFLKSHGTNPNFKNRFIFELVPAKMFCGVLEEYTEMHGYNPIVSASRDDLKGQSWRKVLIGGVASSRRNPEKTYKIQATTLVRLKFPTTAFMWVGRGILTKQFSESVVTAAITRYMMEAGQKPPKAPTERIFKESKEEIEASMRKLEAQLLLAEDSKPEDSKPRRKKATKTKTAITIEGSEEEEEARMTRTRKYKKKTPLKSKHPKSKTSYPDTDGEEGESVAEESERSENESDSGSMARFIDDEHISNEDLEKAMAEIKKIMEQRKK
ncbi:hypothetical protein V497_00305 [Pseudogymnoascus sp. VKM F-4516 (FW-969)]|nr:hypothetical protein V497_00305 [Pseudogymnoascus sp. VKM F-4516 (FW-969)]